MAQAYILINCQPNTRPQVRDEIKNIPEISETKQVFGAYDCIAKTKDLPSKKIRQVIINKIRSNENIRSTLTLNTIPEDKLQI